MGSGDDVEKASEVGRRAGKMGKTLFAVVARTVRDIVQVAYK